ncbi:MAG: phage terminase large subunit [archaeon]
MSNNSASLREIQAVHQMAARIKAREGLIPFCRFVMPHYQIGRPHRIMAEALERVERGECTRLIISMPRRHGKSLMISQMFPCWALGRKPRLKIVQCGYAENLTVSHSRKARDVLAGEKFHALWPEVSHRPETEGQRAVNVVRQTAHEWGTSQGGSYYAVGVGGGLAGRGFSIGIIDDFFKGRSDAQSPTIRDKVYDWFRSVFYPAQDSDLIKENAAIIITATRWHPDDLIARVQKLSCVEGDDEHAEKWEVIELPAIDNDDMALWPERWPLEKLLKIKHTIGSREFSAQYQQDPKDVEGGMFHRDWFKIVKDYPRRTGQPFVRFWDLAGTEKSAKSSDPDWTTGALVTMVDGVWYLVNLRRFRATERTIRNTVQQCAALDPYGTMIRIEQEPGAGSKNLIANYQTDVLVGYDVRAEPSVGDKTLRAGALAAAAEAGNVCLVNGPNVEAFLSEAEALPNGDHDDTVDAFTGALKCIKDRISSGGVAVVTKQQAERTVDGQNYHDDEGAGYGQGRTLTI